MTSNGWFYVVIPSATRDDITGCVLGTDGCCCSWWAFSTPSSSSTPSIRGNFVWYSDATMRALTLTSPYDLTGPVGMLSAIMENKWTRLPLLFDGV